jgi:putative membrane protein
MRGELFLMGVPIWDSLSYTFLSFAGWMMATWLRSRWNPTSPLSELHRSWKTILLGAALTMILDIVIDPLAHLGKYWFLGDIYHYPNPGRYFDVPLSNFAGWFLVSLATLSAFRLTDRLEGIPKTIRSIQWGALLFWGIYLFNLGITLWIRAYALAAASAGWGLLLLLLSRKAKRPGLEM